MTIPPLPLHGGGIQQARQLWPRFDGEWLDLSTGINPHPYDIPTLPPELWHRLPDADLQQELRNAARSHYGAPNQCTVAAAAGSGAIIRTLPLLYEPGTVNVVGPTYGEHAQAWRDNGHHINECAGLDDTRPAQVTIVVNPNNPDGRIYEPDALIRLAQSRPRSLLVVDQAFGDVCPDLSLIPSLPDNAVVLSSFGKFFGLAGLRLGLAFGCDDIIAQLTNRLGPWAVSGPALWLGAKALRDHDWIKATRQSLRDQTLELDRVLASAGLTVAGGTDLFRLIEHPHAHGLWDHLGQRGILTRAFSYRPQWLRLGLPPDSNRTLRLQTALAAFTP